MNARSVIISVLVAAVVGLVALLLWYVRADRGDEPRPAADPTAAPAKAAAGKRVAAPPARAARTPASPATPPTLPEPVPVPPPPTDDGFPALHDARARVLAAARDCIDTPPEGDIPDQSLELKYTIETGGGDAAIRDAEVVSSTLSDELIPECVAERVAGLRWRIADQEEHRFPIQDTIALRELVQ